MTRRALVVDDDEDSCRILGVLLPRIGLDPLFATDGAEGLRIARSQALTLVIAELYLPTGSGRCFVEDMKQDRELVSIPLLVHTAHCTARDMSWASECGCDGFVAKPARWAELEPAIARLLADRPLS